MHKEFDLDVTRESILAEGVPFLETAENILSHFGGTYFIRYHNRQNGEDKAPKLASDVVAHFDAKRAMDQTDPGWFEHWAERIGKQVTPIGACGQDHAVLMVDEAGAIYGGFDECLGRIADSIEEAVLGFADRKRGRWESIPVKEKYE